VRILQGARKIGYSRLSLETGSMACFEPARAFCHRLGFEDCAAFSNYAPDPDSVFMTLVI
jgi:putative acetyltransferase